MPDLDKVKQGLETNQETTTENTTEIKNADALLKAYEATKQEKKALEKQLKAYSGVDLEKYNQLSAIDINRYKELETLEAKLKEQEEQQKVQKLQEEQKWSELLDHQTKKVKTEYENQLKLISESKQELERKLQEQEATRSTLETVNRELRLKGLFEQTYFELGGDPNTTKYVWGDISSQIKESENGLQIVDKDGNIKTDGKGNALSLKDLLSEYKQDSVGSRFFKASQPYGSGVEPQQPSPPSSPVQISQKALMNPQATQAYQEIMAKGKLGIDYVIVP